MDSYHGDKPLFVTDESHVRHRRELSSDSPSEAPGSGTGDYWIGALLYNILIILAVHLDREILFNY